MSNLILQLHIAAGGLALVLGAVALLARKGGTIHRRGGQVFVGAMAVMGITAMPLGNAFGGLMAVYFVATAWTTVRARSLWTRGLDAAAMLFALAFTVVTALAGVEAFGNPGRTRNGVPFLMLFFLATVTALAAFGDFEVLRSGVPRGGARLARHLWRMCFALFIAAGSFFSIRERVARILPEPLLSWPMRLLPILLVFVAMFYWLWKVRRRPPRMVIRNEPPAAGPLPAA
jgi:uncharacterized membrane protein